MPVNVGDIVAHKAVLVTWIHEVPVRYCVVSKTGTVAMLRCIALDGRIDQITVSVPESELVPYPSRNEIRNGLAITAILEAAAEIAAAGSAVPAPANPYHPTPDS